jgi:hypothetical protein
MSTTTDADGTFVFHKIKPGKYKVKPADDKHAFEPASKNVDVGLKKIARADFEMVTSPTPPPPVSLPPWSTYQGNAAHTGYVPVSLSTDNFPVTLNSGNTNKGWTKNIPDIAGLDVDSVTLNPVAAGGGKVFVTTGGDNGPYLAIALYSVDGERVWSDGPFDFGDVDYIGPPAYANGIVYIQSVGNLKSGYGYDPSFLWALDAESGEIVIDDSYYDNHGKRFYAPTVYVDDIDDNIGDDVDDDVDNNENVSVYIGGGYVYEDGGYTGGVYGFNGITGEELWPFDLNEYDKWTPAVNENYVIAYTGWYEPQLTVINRITGKEEFHISDPHFGTGERSMNLAPVLGSQNNVIAIQDGRLISFDLTDRIIGWETLGEAVPVVEGFIGQPSLANGIIYAVYEGFLNARYESNGSLIWEWQPPPGESIVTPMIVTNNLIFVSTESATYAVDLEESHTGVMVYEAGGHLALSDDGVLYIATAQGNLHAIFMSEQF